jgi:hypothetical protein
MAFSDDQEGCRIVPQVLRPEIQAPVNRQTGHLIAPTDDLRFSGVEGQSRV